MSNDKIHDARGERLLPPLDPREDILPQHTHQQRHPRNNRLRRLVVAGNLLAAYIGNTADELDRSSGIDAKRPERALAEAWARSLEGFRNG